MPKLLFPSWRYADQNKAEGLDLKLVSLIVASHDHIQMKTLLGLLSDWSVPMRTGFPGLIQSANTNMDRCVFFDMTTLFF